MTHSEEIQVRQGREPRGVEPKREEAVIAPAADIYELDDKIVIYFDMPGVDVQHINVTMERDVLLVTGERGVSAIDGYDPVVREFGEGVYRRSFTIGVPVDQGHIQARVNNGVLELILPKADKVQPHKIKVENG